MGGCIADELCYYRRKESGVSKLKAKKKIKIKAKVKAKPRARVRIRARAKVRASKTEKFEVRGEELLKEVKRLIKEGNVRRITITNKKGKEVLSFPLTVGVVGAIVAPMLAAVGAVAALLSECTLTVERR